LCIKISKGEDEALENEFICKIYQIFRIFENSEFHTAGLTLLR